MKEKNHSSDQPNRKGVKIIQGESNNSEYRLVSMNSGNQVTDDEIDLIELVSLVWNRRKLVLKFIGFGMIFGLVIAYTSPVEYEASSALMPEFNAESNGGTSDLLRKYGGLLGINGSNSSTALRVDVYPKIVQSTPFQQEIMEMEIYSKEFQTETTVYDYFNEYHSPSSITTVAKAIRQFPYTIKGWFTPENKKADNSSFESGLLQLTEEQMYVVEILKERIKVNYDETTGVVTVSAEMPEAVLSAQIAQSAINYLTDYLVEYRTEKVTNDLNFVEEQLRKAQQRFEEAQDELAEFTDGNVGNLTARAQTEEDRLISQKDLAFSVYQSLAQQFEQAKLAVQERTPIFKVLQPVQVPIDKSKPRRMMILMVFLMLSLLAGIFAAIIRGKFFEGTDSIKKVFRRYDEAISLEMDSLNN